MTYEEFEERFHKEVGEHYKTKDVDRFNQRLVKEHADVSFLKEHVLEKQQYHATYFCVSIQTRDTLDDKFAMIDDNLDLLQDWWHVDQIMKFLGSDLTFSYAYKKAKKYVKDKRPFVRRLGYVIFIPRLVKQPKQVEKLIKLLKNDEEYYVVMGEAWLISFLAMADPDQTYSYLEQCDLAYNIVGKAIQKICDSYVISDEEKEKFKSLRKSRKKR